MNKIALLFFLGIISSFAFPQGSGFRNAEAKNGYYFVLNGMQISLSQEEIKISSDGRSLYEEQLTGRKVMQASAGNKYFIVTAYQYPLDKKDYKITIRVFDSAGNLYNSYKTAAPFDLPHPLFAVSDDGVLVSFNPLNFKLKIIDGPKTGEVKLDENVKSQMERSSFLKINNGSVYVLTSIEPASISSTKPAMLFKVNIQNKTSEKKALRFTLPVSLNLQNGSVFASGLKFTGSNPKAETVKCNSQMEETAAADFAADKIIELDGEYYACSGRDVYKLNNALTMVKKYSFKSPEKIYDVKGVGNEIAVLTVKNGIPSVYILSKDLSVNSSKQVKFLTGANYYQLEKSGDQLFIYSGNNTAIIK